MQSCLFNASCPAQPLRNDGLGDGILEGDPHGLFPTSRLYSKSFDDARQLLNEQKYSVVVPELQSILDAPEDYLKTDAPNNGYESLKEATLRLIATLPDAGRRYYSLQYGPAADQMLQQSEALDDINLLREIVRRYFFTKAGAEAAYALGGYYFERGDFLAATQIWEMLLTQHEQGLSKEPHLTFKLAVAWYQLGNLGKCRQALMQLARLTDGGVYQFPNGMKVSLFTAEENPVEWLSHLTGRLDLRAAREQENWTMYRGSPARTASAEFAVPSAKPLWQFSTIQDPFLQLLKDPPPVEEMLRKLGEHRRFHLTGVLPAASPLVIRDQVIFRTHRNLKSVSLKTGKLSWETTLSDELYQELLKDPQNMDEEFTGSPQTPLEKYLTQRAWQDYTAGHLSTDGKLVFCVENLGFIAGFYHFSRLDRENVLVPNSFNRLMAFEADTGKFVWELGGPRLQNPINYSGHYFLGPPLPLDGKLYCLAEEGREFRLLVLDAETGKTLWTQSLYRSDYPIARDYTTDRRPLDHVRRRIGLSPSSAHGVLVCPTGAGCTIGIDLIQRKLLWRQVDTGGKEISMFAAFARDASENMEGWAEFTPVIVGDRVLIESRKSQTLQCLNLFDGRLLWSRPRRDNLFIAAIHDGKILLVGNDRIEALKLSDGSLAWPKPQTIGAPSGRGIVVKNTYYQPVESGEILSIRLDDGLILARTRVETETLIGNLAAADGMLVAQNESEVVGFQSVTAIEEQIRLASQSQQPKDQAIAQLLKGELKLFAGDVSQAMQFIDRSIQIQPTLRARRLYADMFLESLDHDFSQNEKLISKMESLLVDEGQRRRFFQILAVNYQQRGNLQAALENYLRLSEQQDLLVAEPVTGGGFLRTDRWIRAQLELLVLRSSEEDRKKIAAFFARYYSEKLARADRETLERFLQCCGNLPETQQARMMLVTRLEREIDSASPDEQAFLQSRLMRQLEHLRSSKQSVVAAYATAKLTEIYLAANRIVQAEEYIETLRTRWPDVVCMDGKTASQLAEQWEKRLAASRAQKATPWQGESVQVYRGEQEKGQNTSLTVEITGLSNALFNNYRFEVGPAKEWLFAYDGQGQLQWSFSLLKAEIEVPQQPYFSARVFQQYLVVNFGSEFFVLDTLNCDPEGHPLLLWKQRLMPDPPSVRDYITIERTGVAPVLREYITRNMDRELLGRIGTINEEFICYQIGSDLIAADLLTGKVLWKRQGTGISSRHYGDAERVIVIAGQEQSELRYNILSGQNGKEITTFRLNVGESPIFAFERYLLTLTVEPDNTRLLQLKDLTKNEGIWSLRLSENSTYTLGQNDELVVMQADGTIAFLDLMTGEQKFEVKGQPAEKIINLLVLRNSHQYLVFVSLPYVPPDRVDGNRNRVVFRSLSLTSYLFNGMVYSVDRQTGELMWSLPLDAQGIDFSQFLDLPVITFGIRKIRGITTTDGTQVDLQVVDLRNGDVVLKETTTSNRLRIWVVPDIERNDILIEPFQIRLSFEEPPLAARKPQ
ncbi:PQQ-binding-like beta-propeller repeat protein [Gimesia sp.]|uniref:outer membrane protein assembly factor BamB family protein n=1 Tax=Gimesia sp. TaxID=2024833 RepID=UPI003A8FC661